MAWKLFTVQVFADRSSIFELGVADQLAGDTGRELRRDFRLGGVDVVAPDDQPLVPRPDHAHEAHADAADVGTGLHHPVEDAGAVRDILREIGAEEDVHRAANAHPALEGQARMFGHEGFAAIGADKILRADGEFLAGQAVAAGGGDAALVLRVRQVFGRHAGLRPAGAGGLEEQRLHVGLRQVVHVRGRGHQVLGPGERVVAPGLHPADLLAGEAFAEDVLAHQVLMGGEHVGLVLDVAAKVAQDLHRALVGDVRAGGVGEPAVAVDRHVGDPIGRKQRGSG